MEQNFTCIDLSRKHRIMARVKKKRAERLAALNKSAKKFITGVLFLVALTAIAQYVQADGKPVKTAQVEHERPDYLVSPDMAAYIVTYAHKQLLTEEDME